MMSFFVAIKRVKKNIFHCAPKRERPGMALRIHAHVMSARVSLLRTRCSLVRHLLVMGSV